MTVGVVLAAIVALVVLTSQAENDNEAEDTFESTEYLSSEEPQEVFEPIISENISDEVEAELVPAPDTREPAVTDAPAEEIIFVQNPVVQALPKDETQDTEQENVTVPDGQSID